MNSFSKPRIYTLLCRNLLLPKRQTRTIFTESWMETEGIQKRRQEFLNSCGDVKDCFKTIHKNYERRGIEALSQSQIHDLIHSASTNSECNDKKFVTSVVKSFCLDTDRDKISRRKVIKGFMYLCYDNNDYESAKEVADVAISENLLSRKALRMYMTLLYNSGLYENVFVAYKTCDNATFVPKSQEDFIGFNFDTTLVMAALYQHGTDEAFRDAMELKRDKIERFATDKKGRNNQISFSRGTALAG